MQNGNIEASKANFKTIFSQNFWFVVPEYQRSYVWERDNILELIEDLTYAFENRKEDDYFIGSLVLKQLENKSFPEFEVLDGQQRLTTFFIMMAVIRDIVKEEEYKKTIHRMIYQENDILMSIPERRRITYKIRDEVEDFIKAYLISSEGTCKEDELKKLSKQSNISISHMANAILIMREELLNKNDLIRFITFILNKVVLIYVSTSNTEDAFRMFTILNDRGIPLTNADILKSQNIGELSTDKEIKKYAELWEELENKHGEKFDRFLQFIRTILVKEKARANLLEEFTEKIYKTELLKKGKESFELIKKYNDIYEKIIELQDRNLSNNYKNLLTIMKIGLRSEDWIPPLLYYYDKFNYDKLDEFLFRLEYKFSGDWICGNTPTKRLESVNNILKNIDEAVDCEEVLNNQYIFNVDKNELKNIINGNIYKKDFSKHLLLKIEYIMGDNTVHLSGYKNISIEHVLPQNPNKDSEWVKVFTENEREEWTNKIANLILLSRKKNSSLGNLDFKDKKEKYLNDRIDIFNSSKILINKNNAWNKEVLEERQLYLIDNLINDKYRE